MRLRGRERRACPRRVRHACRRACAWPLPSGCCRCRRLHCRVRLRVRPWPHSRGWRTRPALRGCRPGGTDPRRRPFPARWTRLSEPLPAMSDPPQDRRDTPPFPRAWRNRSFCRPGIDFPDAFPERRGPATLPRGKRYFHRRERSDNASAACLPGLSHAGARSQANSFPPDVPGSP
ncbi:MAG: hypothetical protein BWY66_02066 [bacterium ADurb.Bin374]|nr:MAG: hypothetical protein BWY66_02066 [bacterium ADurb.Bin374]